MNFEIIKPKVKILHYTPLKIVDIAIGTCWDKQRDEDVVDLVRMERVVNKFHHASTAEHVTYNMYIKNMTRMVLQELARTRIANFSVKSSRYTLKELRNEKPFINAIKLLDDDNIFVAVDEEQSKRASNYIRFIKNEEVNRKSVLELELLRMSVKSGISNDESKYNLPDSYLTELTFTINIRSLQNFLNLRTNSKTAHPEIVELAYEMYKQIPDDHKFLFKDNLYIINTELKNAVKDEDFRRHLYNMKNNDELFTHLLSYRDKESLFDNIVEKYSIEVIRKLIDTLNEYKEALKITNL